jgi:hypothetical protein
MAAKVWDGIDHYHNSVDLLSRSGFLQYVLTGRFPATVSFVTGRNGFGKAVQVNSSTSGGTGTEAGLRAVWADRNAEAFFGHGLLVPTVGNLGGYVMNLYDTVANVVQVAIYFNSLNYAIQIYRGTVDAGTLLYASPNNTWSGEVWNFVEVHVKIDNSSGSVAVKVNGVVEATISSVDTQASANAWFDAVEHCGFAYNIFVNPFFSIDDVYYCDTTTGPGLAPCNTYLGDCGTATLFATGNDAVQFTPLAGANWQEISEISMDSDTSYNYSSNLNDEDRFVFQSLPASVNIIIGVQVTGAYRKDAVGARAVQQAVKSGATETYGGVDHNIPDTLYAYFTDLWILNPTTAMNWSTAEVNAMKAAYKITV